MRSETPSPSSTLLPGPYRPSRRRNASGSCGALMPNCTCTKGARTATPVLSTAQPTRNGRGADVRARSLWALRQLCGAGGGGGGGAASPPGGATAHPTAHLLLHRCILCLLIRRQQRFDLFILSLAEGHHLRPAIILRQRRIRAQCLHLRAAVLEDALHLRRLIIREAQILFEHVCAMARIHAAASAPVAGPASVQQVEAVAPDPARKRHPPPQHSTRTRARPSEPSSSLCLSYLYSLSAKCAGLGPGRRRSDYTIDGALGQRVPVSMNDFSGLARPFERFNLAALRHKAERVSVLLRVPLPPA